MDDDVISFGRRPDPRDVVSLRDVLDASYRKLVVQLYAVTGSFVEAEDLVQGPSSGPRRVVADSSPSTTRRPGCGRRR
jgi:hypothetical protein